MVAFKLKGEGTASQNAERVLVIKGEEGCRQMLVDTHSTHITRGKAAIHRLRMCLNSWETHTSVTVESKAGSTKSSKLYTHNTCTVSRMRILSL